jgi:hypothetical protein
MNAQIFCGNEFGAGTARRNYTPEVSNLKLINKIIFN